MYRSMHSSCRLQAAKLDNMEGVMGSQHKPGQTGSHNPGLEGALDVNPDIYRPDEEVIEIENSDFVQPSMTDMDFEMFTIQDEAKDLPVRYPLTPTLTPKP
jgi:hypothetical protein